jgi:peptide methionine sulfoxide reductase msrA/msrB
VKIIFIFIFILSLISCREEKNSSHAMNTPKYSKLTKEEEKIIINKGTEPPFSGKYNDFSKKGVYTCKQCGAKLYFSDDKFNSSCGWPSFDDEIHGAIKKQTDADGRRTEILCANCGAHLGHVFTGENLTDKNVRHCVNSLSMNFVPAADIQKKESTAYFAGGCFWGVEYLFEKKDGVLSAESGYMGGKTENPGYEDVCSKKTGHLEAVKVVYNPEKITYEDLTKYFFEIHDPTQFNGQGPDIGDQYLSAIFYNNDEEKKTAEKLIEILKQKGYKVITKLIPAEKFWPAEDYHQNYYKKKGGQPYCHFYQKRF